MCTAMCPVCYPSPQEVDTGKHTWANYFLAAYKVCGRCLTAEVVCGVMWWVSAAPVTPTGGIQPVAVCCWLMMVLLLLLLLLLHPHMQGVFEHLDAKGLPAPEPVGLQVMVHGTVPLGAGCC